MPLSLNEIRSRAFAFAREWQDASSERAEAQSFWNDFFHVFGVNRRRVASFERPVSNLSTAGGRGRIDLLWKGKLLVEHKSRGEDLDRAAGQARDYFAGLKDADLPRHVVVSDFARLRLYDLDAGTREELPLRDLPQRIDLFGFISGYETRSFGALSEADVEAARLLGALHDQMEDAGYGGHALQVWMVRLLFCLFADTTGIFETGRFREYLDARTAEDGSDLGPRLERLFQVLNTPREARSRALDETLTSLEYVNGRLFAERLPIPDFDSAMRGTLLDCAKVKWGDISPAIFGSLFQSIKDRRERRTLGEHYTTEANILKALRPLFLDGLHAEFTRIRQDARRLQDFHRKLTEVQILDPACGCGNFLVVAYRELRLLELEVLRARYGNEQRQSVAPALVQSIIEVDQFHGIEIEEWPAQIAQVAMWLTDHQMNLRVSEEFGRAYVRLPLTRSANIVHGNALTLDWARVVEPASLDYIVGNPPFGGGKTMDAGQRTEVARIWRGARNAGVLDYVTCWYRKAADMMALNPEIEAALVSTNSITQGEQPAVIWADLAPRGVAINFAHRTFRWTSEARGAAAVHCVVLGFALHNRSPKRLFDYATVEAEPQELRASVINPYLVDAPFTALVNRRAPLCDVPQIGVGNKPIDGGFYLFTPEEKTAFIAAEPGSRRFFRRWVGADEYCYNVERWVLWLRDIQPQELRSLPLVRERVAQVGRFRRGEIPGKNGRRAKSSETADLAATPTLMHVENMPTKQYLILPRHSSEGRKYIPFGWMHPSTLCGDANLLMRDATLYHFGVITSLMHMAWVRAVCGRIKSDYRYSAGIVYNNFPWPNPSAAQRAAIEAGAQAVLDARAAFPDSTLADLYDPTAMPPVLVRAHATLDRAVDAGYGRRSFAGEAERVAFLFEQYQALSAPLAAGTAGKRAKPAKARRARSSAAASA